MNPNRWWEDPNDGETPQVTPEMLAILGLSPAPITFTPTALPTFTTEDTALANARVPDWLGHSELAPSQQVIPAQPAWSPLRPGLVEEQRPAGGDYYNPGKPNVLSPWQVEQATNAPDFAMTPAFFQAIVNSLPKTPEDKAQRHWYARDQMEPPKPTLAAPMDRGQSELASHWGILANRVGGKIGAAQEAKRLAEEQVRAGQRTLKTAGLEPFAPLVRGTQLTQSELENYGKGYEAAPGAWTPIPDVIKPTISAIAPEAMDYGTQALAMGTAMFAPELVAALGPLMAADVVVGAGLGSSLGNPVTRELWQKPGGALAYAAENATPEPGMARVEDMWDKFKYAMDNPEVAEHQWETKNPVAVARDFLTKQDREVQTNLERGLGEAMFPGYWTNFGSGAEKLLNTKTGMKLTEFLTGVAGPTAWTPSGMRAAAKFRYYPDEGLTYEQLVKKAATTRAVEPSSISKAIRGQPQTNAALTDDLLAQAGMGKTEAQVRRAANTSGVLPWREMETRRTDWLSQSTMAVDNIVSEPLVGTVGASGAQAVEQGIKPKIVALLTDTSEHPVARSTSGNIAKLALDTELGIDRANPASIQAGVNKLLKDPMWNTASELGTGTSAQAYLVDRLNGYVEKGLKKLLPGETHMFATKQKAVLNKLYLAQSPVFLAGNMSTDAIGSLMWKNIGYSTPSQIEDWSRRALKGRVDPSVFYGSSFAGAQGKGKVAARVKQLEAELADVARQAGSPEKSTKMFQLESEISRLKAKPVEGAAGAIEDWTETRPTPGRFLKAAVKQQALGAADQAEQWVSVQAVKNIADDNYPKFWSEIVDKKLTPKLQEIMPPEQVAGVVDTLKNLKYSDQVESYLGALTTGNAIPPVRTWRTTANAPLGEIIENLGGRQLLDDIDDVIKELNASGNASPVTLERALRKMKFEQEQAVARGVREAEAAAQDTGTKQRVADLKADIEEIKGSTQVPQKPKAPKKTKKQESGIVQGTLDEFNAEQQAHTRQIDEARAQAIQRARVAGAGETEVFNKMHEADVLAAAEWADGRKLQEAYRAEAAEALAEKQAGRLSQAEYTEIYDALTSKYYRERAVISKNRADHVSALLDSMWGGTPTAPTGPVVVAPTVVGSKSSGKVGTQIPNEEAALAKWESIRAKNASAPVPESNVRASLEARFQQQEGRPVTPGAQIEFRDGKLVEILTPDEEAAYLRISEGAEKLAGRPASEGMHWTIDPETMKPVEVPNVTKPPASGSPTGPDQPARANIPSQPRVTQREGAIPGVDVSQPRTDFLGEGTQFRRTRQEMPFGGASSPRYEPPSSPAETAIPSHPPVIESATIQAQVNAKLLDDVLSAVEENATRNPMVGLNQSALKKLTKFIQKEAIPLQDAAHLAAVDVGVQGRNRILLNYGSNYRQDVAASLGLPWVKWPTRTGKNVGIWLSQHPYAILAYEEARDLNRQWNKQRGVPEERQDDIVLGHMPWQNEGDIAYVRFEDILRSIMPLSGTFSYNRPEDEKTPITNALDFMSSTGLNIDPILTQAAGAFTSVPQDYMSNPVGWTAPLRSATGWNLPNKLYYGLAQGAHTAARGILSTLTGKEQPVTEIESDPEWVKLAIGRELFGLYTDGRVTEDEYNKAIASRKGDAWKMAEDEWRSYRKVEDVANILVRIRPRSWTEEQQEMAGAKKEWKALRDKYGESIPGSETEAFKEQYPGYLEFSNIYNQPTEAAHSLGRTEYYNKLEPHQKTLQDTLAKTGFWDKAAESKAYDEYNAAKEALQKEFPDWNWAPGTNKPSDADRNDALMRELNASKPAYDADDPEYYDKVKAWEDDLQTTAKTLPGWQEAAKENPNVYGQASKLYLETWQKENDTARDAVKKAYDIYEATYWEAKDAKQPLPPTPSPAELVQTAQMLYPNRFDTTELNEVVNALPIPDAEEVWRQNNPGKAYRSDLMDQFWGLIGTKANPGILTDAQQKAVTDYRSGSYSAAVEALLNAESRNQVSDATVVKALSDIEKATGVKPPEIKQSGNQTSPVQPTSGVQTITPVQNTTKNVSSSTMPAATISKEPLTVTTRTGVTMDVTPVIQRIIAQFGSLANWEAQFRKEHNGQAPAEDSNLLAQGYTPDQALAEHLRAFGAVQPTGAGGTPTRADWQKQWQAQQGKPRAQLSDFMPPQQAAPQQGPMPQGPGQQATIMRANAQVPSWITRSEAGPSTQFPQETAPTGPEDVYQRIISELGPDVIEAITSDVVEDPRLQRIAMSAFRKYPMGARSVLDWIDWLKQAGQVYGGATRTTNFR